MAENIVYTGSKTFGSDAPAGVTGKVVFDATAITAADYVEIKLGFKPTYVEWENATDRTQIVHYAGMADNTCVKTIAAGTRTLETTNGGITLTDTGFRVTQNATLAAILASKTCYYRAEA